MAFLDNSGDIILDAVLTDAGRQRMAKGNFKIVKYAFGDEEVNYQQFNSNHPSGSAFHDLEIMQTPVLEALTNNTSTMNSKLFTMSRSNILYLPVLRLNSEWQPTTAGGVDAPQKTRQALGVNAGTFVVTTSKATEDAFHDASNPNTGNWMQRDQEPPGVMYGGPLAQYASNYICIDQGIVSTGNPSIQQDLPTDLLETQFIVQIDHRLGRISNCGTGANKTTDGTATMGGTPNTVQPYSFVDDDNIASYYFGMGSDSGMITTLRREGNPGEDLYNLWKSRMAYAGPVGTSLRFRIQSSLNLQESSALFTELGGSGTKAVAGSTSGNIKALYTAANTGAADTAFKFIDTLVRVIGVTTGYRLDIPVRFIRI